MGFFSDNSVAPVGGLPPLTVDRIEAWLRARDYNYGSNDDGTLYGGWGENLMWFLRFGQAHEVLQVRGRYGHPLAQSQRGEMLQFINEWHCERIWPKLYLSESEGQLHLFAEVSVDLEHGVTDEQLFQYLDCGLGTAMSVFNSLDKRLGHASE